MISIIVGASDNNVIGHLNKLPWYLPRDLKNFSALTTGHTTIMGRKTFESIMARLGKPLPNRQSIIITKQKDFQTPEGCAVANNWSEAIQKATDREIFVSGGTEIYKLALPDTQRIYLTRIHTTCDGDVYLPITDFSDWKLIHEEQWPKDEKNQFNATYQIYERK
jgi:dihydrofolate reductase